MNRCRPIAILALAALSAGLNAGCSTSKSKVLAEVGDYRITEQEFNEFYRVQVPHRTVEEEFEARMKALDSAITTRLLIQAAYEKGIDTLEELARVVLANKDKFLLNVLLQRQIEDKVRPMETELKDFYKHLEFKIKASHILVDNLDTARMLLERLQTGENFEKLAY